MAADHPEYAVSTMNTYKLVLSALILLFGRSVFAVQDGAASERLGPELAAAVVEEIVPEVESIRGLRFRNPVPVAVIDDDAARAHMLRRFDAFGMREQLVHTQRAYAALGLIAPGTDLLEVSLSVLREQAGGFYDPQTGSYFLLDDMPATAVGILTAHELTHALEDQYFDLDERLLAALDDDDRSFALGAVHEGSATLVMAAYSAQAMLRGELGLEELQTYEAEMGATEGLEALPPVLLRQLLGPYWLGMAFLTRGKPAAAAITGFPVDDVNRAFRDGPVSSEQILHPEKYWDPARRDLPRDVRLGDAGARLGKGWTKVSEGVLGEVTLGLLCGAETSLDPTALLTGGAGWTNEAASGWGGDRWELWQRKRTFVALLQTVWDTERDAEEFEAAVRAPGLRLRRAGDRVAVVGGSVGRRADAVLDAMLRGSQPGKTARPQAPRPAAGAVQGGGGGSSGG